MRFVAGRGAMAELLVRAAGESSWLDALRQRAIGKLLLAGDAIGKTCWLGRPDRAATGRGAAAKSHREEGAMAKVPGSYVKFGKECTFAA